ncbi:MAG TPA: tripartite tricarboxylate transporter TctB family protein [Xanthobacteraceae bacterium]|nr:tripartite tricarboxylate transporter TctB family protein [Xanthobacteraceae bacterium]
MSNSSDVSPRGGPLGFIRAPRDFWGGLGLVALALVAWYASRDLPGQQGFAFGPGTAPRLFMFLLGANGLIIAATGLLVEGPALEKWAFRGPLFVLGSVLLFAATIRPLGLVLSTFLLVMVSSAGTREVRWLEAAIWGVVLAIFCAILFPYVLNLPMQLWPRF